MKQIFLTTAILFSIIFNKAMAQNNAGSTPAVLNHIAVYVSDLKQSTVFYESVFNLKIIPEPFHDNRHTWFSLGPAGQLHLIQGLKGTQNFDKNEHLCFSVPSVDEFVKKLNAQHISFEDWAGKEKGITLRVDGVKQIYFKDPDGHWLEVNDAK
ncbi:VOC family protein [Pedobacter soli]|uniref:Lactoylglutathione lyase n=1 Tax=Pedobacter soli TaxID=390242 RepID=A0A1G6RZA6_9SPHI|nr:VOC family protein [Pedobacter soli]SDD09734.1 lactoylglutathione lyase [Pedobacter soli]